MTDEAAEGRDAFLESGARLVRLALLIRRGELSIATRDRQGQGFRVRRGRGRNCAVCNTSATLPPLQFDNRQEETH